MKLRSKATTMSNVERDMRLFVRRDRRQRANRERMRGQSIDAKAWKTQKAVLTRCPVEVCRDCDTREAVFFEDDLCFLAETVFEAGTDPGEDQAGDVDGCCCDEVVPGGNYWLYRE